MHVARQPIQLGHGHRTTLTAGLAEGCCKLWPAVQSVNAFACLDLDKHAKKLKAFRGREARESFPLCLQAQTGATLLGRRNPGVPNERPGGSNRAPSRYGLIGRHNRELAFASWFHGGARGNGPGCSGVVAESGVPPKMRRASEGRPGGLSS